MRSPSRRRPPSRFFGATSLAVKMASFEPVRLAYDRYEPVTGADPDLAPVIYLHGITATKENWEEIPQVVANVTRRVSYAVDARNHGDSEWSDHFSFDANVEDLVHFMDSREIGRAVVVGHSMGGLTAIKAALRKPDRVEKIVVEDMTVRKVPEMSTASALKYFSLARRALEAAPDGLEEDQLKRFVVRHIYQDMPPEMKKMALAGKSEDDVESNARFMAVRRGADGRYATKCNLDAIERFLRNKRTLDSELEGQSAVPACFIYGKLSPFKVGDDEPLIRQFFPDATLEGIEGAGHDGHYSKPLEFTDALLTFLSRRS